MSDVFISYKQDERARMVPIADGLRQLGVDVWFDERLQPDRSFTEEIQHLLQTCKAQLVCWSPAAVASEWVRGEAEKGRQRGVLIAALIEPCDLPPPFNMHHAESLVGWSGDARHPSWRKIVDAIGRKLDRPGLGELAALQVSTDAAAWKKWAHKYSADPLGDAAWAKAEELEIGAARERMARDRDAARRAREEDAARRADADAQAQARREEDARLSAARAAQAPVAAASDPRPRRGLSPFALGIGMCALGLVSAGIFFIVTQPQRGDALQIPTSITASTTSTSTRNEARIRELESQLAALREQRQERASEGARTGNQDIEIRQVEAQLAAARASTQVTSATSPPLADQSVHASPATSTTHAALQPACRVIGEGGSCAQEPSNGITIDQIGQREWMTANFYELEEIADRVLVTTSLNSLERMAANDARAELMLAMAQYSVADVSNGGRDGADDRAEPIVRRAASRGFAPAQYALAYMYQQGYAGGGDPIQYYLQAGRQGHVRAQRIIGLYYEFDFDHRNRDEAVRWYQLAARQGDPEAQNDLRRLGEAW